MSSRWKEEARIPETEKGLEDLVTTETTHLKAFYNFPV